MSTTFAPIPRRVVASLALLLFPTFVGARSARAASGFGFEEVVARAKALAERSFEEPRKIPKWLLDITYDQWRDIRFRPDHALWLDRGERFTIQFFHPGLYYDRTVDVNVVDPSGARPVASSTDQFDYGKNRFAKRIPQNLGFAGFRVHYPMNRPEYRDEVIVFLGASYFRAIAREQGYGLSARGLAIDTAMPSGEEFPFFREYWLVRPAADADRLTIYALLDSPRIAGAYQFVVRPGEQTVLEVECRLFPRKPITKLGIAPLTSMFFYGENAIRRFDRWVPENHDSDGLLLWSSTGEWLWRPLDNPDNVRGSAFVMQNPRGFGLLQRDRNFDHYQDLETRLERRPSVWIVPRGDWGDGHVELIEFPTNTDIHDNVVSFWVPAEAPRPGEPIALAYDMYWYRDDPARPPGGRVIATRRDSGKFENAQRFVLDFEGGDLKTLAADAPVAAVISLGPGEDAKTLLIEQQVEKNPITGGWRLVFQVHRPGEQPLEMRAFLQKGNDALTETWSYRLSP